MRTAPGCFHPFVQSGQGFQVDEYGNICQLDQKQAEIYAEQLAKSFEVVEK
jgi:hypothetical protein